MKKNKSVLIAALISTIGLSGFYALSFSSKAEPSVRIPIPWRSAVAGFFGFAALFFFLKQKHLILREQKHFTLIIREKGMLPAVKEGIYQVLLAGVIFLLFALLGVLGDSLYLAVFFGLSSVILAVYICLTKMPDNLRKVLPLVGYVVLVSYSMYILTMHGYSGWSPKGREVFIPVAKSAMNWIRVLGLFLVILEFWKKEKRVWAICIFGVLMYVVYKETRRPLPLEFFTLVLLGNALGKPRTTAKVMLCFLLTYVVFLAAALAAGLVENRSFYFDYAGWAQAYGMGHSNLPALVLMSILLLSWYLWLTDHPLVTIAVFWLSAAGVWYLTYCRTVLIMLAVFPIMNISRTIVCRAKKNRGMSLLYWTPLVMAAVSVFGMFWVPKQRLFSSQGNMFMRFTNPYDVALVSGVHLFGAVFDPRPIIDNLYLHVLVFYGSVTLVLMTGLFVWIGRKYYKNRQYAELVMLSFFTIYSFMENAMIHMPFGFTLLLIGAMQGKVLTEEKQIEKNEPVKAAEEKGEWRKNNA